VRCAGKVELPAWPAQGMCTLEYVPHVREALRRCCEAAGNSLAHRRGLFAALALAGLGQLAEVDDVTCRWVSHVCTGPLSSVASRLADMKRAMDSQGLTPLCVTAVSVLMPCSLPGFRSYV
jgi:hypothetical protein